MSACTGKMTGKVHQVITIQQDRRWLAISVNFDLQTAVLRWRCARLIHGPATETSPSSRAGTMLATSRRLFQKLERRAIGTDGLLDEVGSGVGASGVVEAFKIGTVRSGHGERNPNDEDKGTHLHRHRHWHRHLERRGGGVAVERKGLQLVLRSMKVNV